MKVLMEEFREWLDGLYGVYLNAIHGFPLVQKERIDQRAAAPPNVPGVEFAYARLVKGGVLPRPMHLHQVDIDTVIQRNASGGQNSVLIGRMFIVSLYNFWEDHTRQKLAEMLQADPAQLQIPLMGDLGRIRNAIVHHRSKMDDRARRLEILRWYSEGDMVSPTRDQIEEIVDRCVTLSEDLATKPITFLKPEPNQAPDPTAPSRRGSA